MPAVLRKGRRQRAGDGKWVKNGMISRIRVGIALAPAGGTSRLRLQGECPMTRFRQLTAAALLASFVAVPAAPAVAAPVPDDHRYEDRWDRNRDYRDHDRWDRRDNRRRDGRWDRRDDRIYRDDRYRDDRYHRGRRMGRNDRIWRGADNRIYCRRDDGTAGAVVGGISGGVLGSVIAPRGSKTLGAILGAIAGSALGKAANDGDYYCR
jgi:hypothetical protein